MQRNISSNKILFHLDTVKKVFDNNCFSPICLEIHPTNFCNHYCVNCISKNNREKHSKSINGNVLLDVLKTFKNNGGKAILWSGGGEPLLYKCKETGLVFKDIMLFANKLGLKQGLYTNGELMNDDVMDVVLSSCSFLRFSCDAFSAKTHKRIHRVDNYNKISAHIQNCLTIRKQKKYDVDIGVSYVVYDNNISDFFTSIKRWFKKHPVDYVYFKPGTILNKTFFSRIKQIMAFKYLNLISKRHKHFPMELAQAKINNISRDQKALPLKNCYIPSLFPTLTADATLYYCCLTAYNDKFLISDLSNETLEKVYSTFRLNQDIDFSKCPINCRGHIINKDIQYAIDMSNNKHVDFL